MGFRVKKKKKNNVQKAKLDNRIEGPGSVIVRPGQSWHEPSQVNAIISIRGRGSGKSFKKNKGVTSLLMRCFSGPSTVVMEVSQDISTPESPIVMKDSILTSSKDIQCSLESESSKSFSSSCPEDYFSAVSTFEDIFRSMPENFDPDSSSQMIQIQKLNAHAPAAIPTNSVSASEQLVEHLPRQSGICGKWIKSYTESTPVPGAADKVISAGFAVQRVRNKLCRFNFTETEDELTLEIVVPVMGMAPWIENYKKDGSLCEFRNRRDYRSGRAFGQAMVLSDGRIMLRVWNLGSSPEVMWEETIERGENALKLEHHAYRLDGIKSGTQSSTLHRDS